VLALPMPYDPHQPYPLVPGFHGSFSDGSKIRTLLDLEVGARAVFVYPDGLSEGWTLTKDGRDVGFVDDIVRDTEGDVASTITRSSPWASATAAG
jgi:hypothetical protein